VPTVVIADDSPTLRRILTSVLTKEGFEVVVAEDGVSAVQQVFATMPDAVVLDVQMPRVSGYVAARLLKDDWQTADIPVILLTVTSRRISRRRSSSSRCAK
jgi:chemosensory pili system protein ChpA (sensor histidine kinase/response regulator)